VERQSQYGRRRWVRTAGSLAVAAAALTAPTLAAAPASASSQTVIHPEWVDGCGGCPGPLFNVQAQLDERTIKRVTDSVASGFAGLIASAHLKDPAEIRKLHQAAMTTLAGGVAQAGNAAWDAGDPDGELCPRLKWPFTGPRPHWDETMKDFAEGLTVLGEANRTGDQKLVDTASGLLDTGAAGLTDFEGCVGQAG
jgi:hypothetical protein